MFFPQGRAQVGNRILLEDGGAVDQQTGVRQIADARFSQAVGGARIAQIRGVKPAIDAQGPDLHLQVEGLLERGVVMGGDVPSLARPMRRAAPVMRAALVPIAILLSTFLRRQYRQFILSKTAGGRM